MKATRIAINTLSGLALFLATGQIGVGAQVINPPPALINFQGRLAKPDGTPVTDGTNYAITLSLWDAQSGGAKRWEQTFNNITVRNGVFAVLLNLNNGFTSGNTLDTTLNNNTYLQVQVGNGPALTPRQQLVSNAYALKAATVPDGSISMSKLDTNLKKSVLGGAAGGDLTGAYPNPLIKTDSALLTKVSGTLLSVASPSTVVDQGQTAVTNTVTSSAWQSFQPGSTGTLVEIDVNSGTTGAAVSATLTLYDGIGTGGAILQTIPITIQPSQGLQAFPITASVTAGHDYTWAIGSNNNLTFGYTGGKPYANGVSDLGTTFSYAFQTRMRVTTTPATQITSNASLFFNNGYAIQEAATIGPMIVKQYSPFTSGIYNGIGRFGLFQTDANTLFLSIPNDVSSQSLRFGTWSPSGTRSDLMTLSNSGNVGIGTATPGFPLSFANALGDKISLFGQTGNTVGFGVQGNQLQIHSDVSTSDVVFGYGNSTNLTETMRIKGNGNVGIGVNAPQSALHIAPISGITIGQNFSSGGYTALNINLSAAQSGNAQIQAIKSSGAAFGDLILNPAPAGYVGIGTTTPDAKLSVVGNVHITGSGAGIVFPDGTTQTTAPVFSGAVAGGDLTGTFPNPTIAANKVGNTKLTSDAASLSKVSGGAMASDGTSIGIGVAPSSYKLDVAGNTQLRGQLVMGGGLTSYAKLSMQIDAGDPVFECINATTSANNGIAIVGISTTAGGYGLEGRNFASNGVAVHAVGRAGGSSGWENLSDARFKTDVQTFPDALGTIMGLRGVTFDWKQNEFPNQAFPAGQQVGFIAQEVEKVLPQIVNKNGEGYRSVMYASVVPVLVEAMKQQQKQITQKDSEVAELRAENAAMKGRLDAIEKLLIRGRKP